MDKDDIKAVVKKAKSSAEKGIKKAGDVAVKAAAGVNDGLDNARENLKKAVFAKDAMHEIQARIKELEEDNKVRTYASVYEETKVIICKLKDLSKQIKNDPENSVCDIDLLAAEFRARLKELRERDVTGEKLQIAQVLSKRYEDAIMTCDNTKAAIETAKKKTRQWYIIRNDSAEELGYGLIVIDTAKRLNLVCAHVISGAGDVSAVGAYCNFEELQKLLDKLGKDVNDVGIANAAEAKLFEHNKRK